MSVSLGSPHVGPVEVTAGLRLGATTGWLLVPVAATCAVATLAWDGLLTGPAVMNGSAKGTALVVLAAALPLLVVSLWVGPAGSRWAMIGALGATAYLLYNAVLFIFATPFNQMFLGYVAMLGLALWTLVLLLVTALTQPIGAEVRHRGVALFMGVVVLLNALAWLVRILPATFDERPLSVMDGTGLTTSPLYVQDLAIWLPAFAWLAVELWRGTSLFLVPAAGALLFWTIESVGVAVDQWWGHHADPTSDVASGAVVPLFLLLAVGTAVALVSLVRRVVHTESAVMSRHAAEAAGEGASSASST